jgi:DNA transformation protein
MSEFVDHLSSVFAELGPIRTRRMFGGCGIYLGEEMFGLVADDVLYLKADDDSKQRFVDRGLGPFVYEKNGKPMQMSYYAAPEAIFDDPTAAKHWGQAAVEAALRGKTKPGRKPRS